MGELGITPLPRYLANVLNAHKAYQLQRYYFQNLDRDY
jgi:hypothetical protein